ncbi:MAG: glycoside hydrolase family 9 protein [Sporocytophaga sp.]|uniref:glycoside hydrolase family 9 protein n=1 Tax=Sporocytophaga sp. TaxID=2231183 RepID=UPI001B167654|nr:glycoside hydrolase family 9 protein [Sporocytophaga sp.]MBO9702634.1 glycoside hydrolase family 9 protein [Sporocytophaga sp.]
MNKLFYRLFLFSFILIYTSSKAQQESLKINDLEYLEMTGLNVMLAHDFYPESHQGGVGIIQNGLRIGTNGDLRLEPTPGQWQPVPKVGKRMVDRNKNEISVRMEYPDQEKNRKGFNPIIYPDLNFSYTLKIKPEGKAVRVIVDLDKPLPKEWIGKVGFNFELFPGILFGKSYYMDQSFGIFPRQLNGPGFIDQDKQYQTTPMAEGNKLVVAPESDRQRLVIENLKGNKLQLIDGRSQHNNGWFVVRSLVPEGAANNAIEWLITPHAIAGWKYEPVVQLSQVGYHPFQQKVAIVELDASETQRYPVTLYRIGENGVMEKTLETTSNDWGKFIRYKYLKFDFSSIKQPGMYVVKYNTYTTEPFQISKDVFKRNVWQPTLETFLPAQMCHMKVNDRYKVWHGFCHLDDARMASTDTNHFDGYLQGSSTLCKHASGDRASGLNRGGWHDAGDFDLRVESQAETVHGLALAYELFKTNYDNTSIDQVNKIVEIHQPDGKPDMLQQIEHGLLSIVGGYESLGRLYRGIICPTLRQYVLLGDPANMTDNKNYVMKASSTTPKVGYPGSADDRWVFTENNPERELFVAAALASSSRVMKGFNDTLASKSLFIAEELWNRTKESDPLQRVKLANELLITTKDKKYADFLVAHTDLISKSIEQTGHVVGRSFSLINNKKYKDAILKAVKAFRAKVDEQEKRNPYGIPYEPYIWGAGWGIQNFGVQQYFLHTSFPEIFPDTYMLHAMNFILGCHPGSNTSSFASGIGSKSLTVAYGFNRDDWSYIPGGIASGTALIRPDYPELLEWPYLWQQTEYVLGGGTTDYLFLILAADALLEKK